MSDHLQLASMTIEEKLQAMEALWADLCSKGDLPTSPAWHGEVLTHREVALEQGDEAFESWEDARRRIEQELD